MFWASQFEAPSLLPFEENVCADDESLNYNYLTTRTMQLNFNRNDELWQEIEVGACLQGASRIDGV